jgi:invasion protein IalB
MLGCTSPFLSARRRFSAGAALIAAGIFLLAGAAAAQAPAPAPATKPAEPKKPTQPKAGAAPKAATNAANNQVWVKLCEVVPTGIGYKDGKEVTRGSKYCLTQHETLDGKTGRAILSAALRQMDGEEKQYFMVMVPLGMMLKAGMRVALYPKDAWEQLRKNEKVDETKLKGLKLEYTLCHAAGCTAQAESTPELLNDLKAFGGMVVFAINSTGEAVPYPVPLTGFDLAHAGAGVDAKQYVESRKVLAQQIEQRQRELAEQAKKQTPEAGKAAPAPAPAPPVKK